MPRDPQVPHFSRTLRVRNVNQIGVLASVLSVIARHGGNVGDIRTVHQSRISMERDIDILVESLPELDVILAELERMAECTVLELRDEVLSAHVGGKIRVLSRLPIETFAELGRVYTPGVGEVCRRIYEDPELAEHYTIIPNTVAIVSDGSAVLGLGNLGPLAAMPVLEGKAALMAHLVGVNAFPIALRTQKTEEIVAAIAAISPSFGAIQLEDIASPRCFDIEPQVQDAVGIAVFHDDQHGTAAVVLAALINACHLAETPADSLRIGQIGLGAAGLAIARAVMHYTGQPVLGADRVADAIERLVACGGKGSDIDEICATCDVVIATTGQAGLISADRIRPGQMIFALSNPRPEIDAREAIAAGARFAENGSQINNLLCYPGACRGLLDAGAVRAAPEVFLAAGQAIVSLTPPGSLLPSPLERSVHYAVARAVARVCVDLGLSSRELPPDYFAEE
ncbi:MAG: NAD-dependent malic enzyme [Dehalococcoidia bacterium]|nr:NAD-dependent malic enzyme [Dehalococcoidia bacterium]